NGDSDERPDDAHRRLRSSTSHPTRRAGLRFQPPFKRSPLWPERCAVVVGRIGKRDRLARRDIHELEHQELPCDEPRAIGREAVATAIHRWPGNYAKTARVGSQGEEPATDMIGGNDGLTIGSTMNVPAFDA